MQVRGTTPCIVTNFILFRTMADYFSQNILYETAVFFTWLSFTCLAISNILFIEGVIMVHQCIEGKFNNKERVYCCKTNMKWIEHKKSLSWHRYWDSREVMKKMRPPLAKQIDTKLVLFLIWCDEEKSFT